MRLFVALDIPDAVRDSLNRICADLRKTLPQTRPPIKWVRLEGAHITLKFIGEVPNSDAARIAEALRAMRGRASSIAPFDLVFAGLGFFPDGRRPRIFWAGIQAVPQTNTQANLQGSALASLAAAIDDVLATLGIPRESRDFHPHVTLARLEPRSDLAAFRSAVQERGAPEFGRAIVREFSLYRSVLHKAGAEYTRLETYPIGGDQIV